MADGEGLALRYVVATLLGTNFVLISSPWSLLLHDVRNGGWGGIRTPGTVAGSTVFKTAAIDHSATHPCVVVSCRVPEGGQLSSTEHHALIRICSG